MNTPRPQPTRIDQWLTITVLALLLLGCFLVLQPFLTAVVWAVILTVTAWPLYIRVRNSVGNRHNVAAAIMVLLIALTLLAPFIIVGATIADNAERLSEVLRGLAERGPPEPPAWLPSIPLVGSLASEYWGGFTHDTARVFDELRKWAEPLRRALFVGGATILGGFLQLSLSILLAYFFFRDGDTAHGSLRAAIERIAPRRGMRLLGVASGTIRGVVFGILGTALAQGILMAIGAGIAGVRAAPLLGFLVFLLSPIPVGPPLVWGAAAIWLFAQDQTGWGIFMLVWGAAIVSTVDNVIRPLIISHGSKLPFVLVLLGVIGGAVAFGVIGLFLGPVLLAVGYVLVKEWAVYVPPDNGADASPPRDGAA